jgi:AcrR family transcriptional regulator
VFDVRGSGERKSARQPRDAGREKLLEAARTLFRAKTKYEVSRLEIARAAGVTPALLTYYFEDNRQLVLAATQPILAEAIAKLFTAIDSELPCPDRLHRVVTLFLDFAEHNAPLLDIFVDAAVDGHDHAAQMLIGSTLEKLSGFFAEAVEAGIIAPDVNPRFFLLALWGMCRLVGGAQPIALGAFASTTDPADLRRVQADLILDLALNGAGKRDRH